MITAQQLEDWSKDIKPVIFDINVALNNLMVLNHENSNNFKRDQPEVYLTLCYQQHFIITVQLAKIFSNSDKQKRNINKLCTRFKSETLDHRITDLLNTNAAIPNLFKNRKEILESVDEILFDLQSNLVDIKIILDLRDEVFAHTDPEATGELIAIEQLKKLTNLVNKIYDSLFGRIFGHLFNNHLAFKWDIRKFIELYNQEIQS